MQTALVARLALAALATVPALAVGATAQDAVDVFSTAPRLRAAAQPDKPMLGVMVTDTEDGVLISEILPGSLAEQAGLQPGDLLLKLGGEMLDTYTEIGDVLGDLEPGSSVSMTVVREGEGLVKLEGSLPEPEPEVIEIEEEILADGHQGGFLGVELGGQTDGVVVAGVIDNTAAWFAGLEVGDVLTHIDGTDLDEYSDLAGAVSSKAPGTMIAIGYERDGVDSEAHVRLGHRMPMLLPGMPGSGQLPQIFGEGDQWFGELPQGGGMRLKVPGGAQGFSFDGQAIELKELEDMHKELMKLHEGMQLHEGIEFHGDDHEVTITIEDGVLTIDRDGEVEVHEIEGTAGVFDGQIQQLMGDVGAIAVFADSVDTAPECAEMSECEVEAECAEMAECAEVSECEEKTDCDVEMECEVEVECADETADDDDDAVL